MSTTAWKVTLTGIIVTNTGDPGDWALEAIIDELAELAVQSVQLTAHAPDLAATEPPAPTIPPAQPAPTHED